MIENYDDIKGLLPWDEDDVDPTPTPQPEAFPEIHEADPDAIPIEEDTSKIMWHAMEEYHGMGFSMMWGRAEDDPKSDKKAKSPIVATWSSNEDTMFTLHTLANVMAKQTIKIAPIIICGKASGNLIVIDIDVKHMPGIDAKFLTALRETYPELYKLIRRHKTPSSGYHLFYRTTEFIQFVPKNPGLAYPAEGKMAGIETRTHGGYVMAPPGLGYSVEYDVPVPTISVEDHEKVFALARLFNERVKIIKPRTIKAYNDIYEENQNPFDAYNDSLEAQKILELHGWKFDYENTQFAHWTRPGKSGGVSASYHKEKGFYHFFTSSTEFDDSHFNGNYSPVAVKCLLEANNDYKKLYVILKNEGYGKHKPDYEAKYIKKAVETGKALPANFSEEAKAQLEVAISEKDSKYPHGIYWRYKVSNDTYEISPELLDRFLYNLGLRLYDKEPVIIEGQFVRKLKESKRGNGERDVYNIIKSWIKEEEDLIKIAICDKLSSFWRDSGEFTVTKLSLLDDSILLKSNSKVVYNCFLNGILVIGDGPRRVSPYLEFEGKLVWSDRVLQHEFHYVPPDVQKESIYCRFLDKAIASDPEYKKLVIGYSVCGYKSRDEGYVILMAEPRHSSKGGGSGKGVFFKLLTLMEPGMVLNGESVKREKDIDQLLQSWRKGLGLVHLSDLPEWVKLSVLKNLATDDIQWKRLYQNIVNLMFEETPKFYCSTQFGIDIKSDGGLAGRIRELAFTDYFGRNTRSVSDEFGGLIPDIWAKADWDGYFSYMADAIEAWMLVRKLEVVEDMGLWEKGFDVRFSGGKGCLRADIDEIIIDWSEKDFVTNAEVWKWYEEASKKIPIFSRIKVVAELHDAIAEYGEKMKLFEYSHGNDKDRKHHLGKRHRVVKVRMLKVNDESDKLDENESDEKAEEPD